MPSPLRVVLRSNVLPEPPSIATSLDWTQREDCTWDPDQRQWVGQVNLHGHVEDVDLKFVIKGPTRAKDIWQSGENLHISKDQLDRTHFYGDLDVAFLSHRWPAADVPSPARHVFDPPASLAQPDVIVVGSGMGGGSLAYSLAAQKRKGVPLQVLVVEGGSYLLPTHVGNLPRPEVTALADQQQPWALWDDYYRVAVETDFESPLPGKEPSISRALNLGGRSVFWGGLAPWPERWEISMWPTPVQDDLPKYAERAKRLMRVAPLGGVGTNDASYEHDVVDALRTASSAPSPLEFFRFDAAPIAAEYRAPILSMVPTGVFSTAELLMARKQSRTSDGNPLFPNVTVLLNHEVSDLQAVSKGAKVSITGVTARNRVSGASRTLRLAEGGQVVLAAGATVTPRIAATISRGSNKRWIGRGLTDHAIWVQPFVISADQQDWFRTDDAAVVLARPKDPISAAHVPFNIRVALNTHLAMARIVDPGNYPRMIGEMPCEVVFLLSAGLIDENVVTGSVSAPLVKLARLPEITPEVRDRIKSCTADIVGRFGGTWDVKDGFVASFGGVGHEVGTMRMTDQPGQEGAVDTDLLVAGTSNVHVCDLSVFPSSLPSNPSLTLVALALRLADRLGGQ